MLFESAPSSACASSAAGYAHPHPYLDDSSSPSPTCLPSAHHTRYASADGAHAPIDADVPPQALYSVYLHDHPDADQEQRQRAQQRYARALERKLGSAQAVYETLQVLQRLEESDPEEFTPEHISQLQALYRRWQNATRAATEAALQGLAPSETGFFEVQLNHP